MIHESCKTHLDMPSMSSLGHLEVKKKNLVHLVLDLFFRIEICWVFLVSNLVNSSCMF